MRRAISIATFTLGCAVSAPALQAHASDPAPAGAVAQLLEHALPSPRFYRLSVSGEMKHNDGFKWCLSGEALGKMMSGIEALASDPKALAELNKGCTNKTTRQGPAVSVERDCKTSAGAEFTSYLRVFGTPEDIRQHMEITLPGMGPGGSDKPLVS